MEFRRLLEDLFFLLIVGFFLYRIWKSGAAPNCDRTSDWERHQVTLDKEESANDRGPL